MLYMINWIYYKRRKSDSLNLCSSGDMRHVIANKEQGILSPKTDSKTYTS